MTYDTVQLHRLYEQDTCMMVNPPTFTSWLSARNRREAYEERQSNTRKQMESFDYDPWTDSYY